MEKEEYKPTNWNEKDVSKLKIRNMKRERDEKNEHRRQLLINKIKNMIDRLSSY